MKQTDQNTAVGLDRAFKALKGETPIHDDPEQIDEETFRCGKCKRISFYTEQGKDDLCVNCTSDKQPCNIAFFGKSKTVYKSRP